MPQESGERDVRLLHTTHGVCTACDACRYAFAMDSVAVLTGALPIARYNASYARALGRWAHSAVNAARLFYPAFNDPAHQSNWAWVESTGSPVGYEGLRKWGFNATIANITGECILAMIVASAGD
jgi:hypothetical protein